MSRKCTAHIPSSSHTACMLFDVASPKPNPMFFRSRDRSQEPDLIYLYVLQDQHGMRIPTPFETQQVSSLAARVPPDARRDDRDGPAVRLHGSGGTIGALSCKFRCFCSCGSASWPSKVRMCRFTRIDMAVVLFTALRQLPTSQSVGQSVSRSKRSIEKSAPLQREGCRWSSEHVLRIGCVGRRDMHVIGAGAPISLLFWKEPSRLSLRINLLLPIFGRIDTSCRIANERTKTDLLTAIILTRFLLFLFRFFFFFLFLFRTYGKLQSGHMDLAKRDSPIFIAVCFTILIVTPTTTFRGFLPYSSRSEFSVWNMVFRLCRAVVAP